MLLELVDDARIASLTALARDPDLSVHHARARGLPVNHGAVEEIVTARADLVLSGESTSPFAERLLARLDIPVLRFEHPATFAAYRENLLRLARALDALPRARALLAELDRRLQDDTGGDGRRAIVYQPNGYAPGRDTLMHDILRHAGLRNVATELGLDFGGFVALESVLLARPDLIVLSTRGGSGPALADAVLAHPALHHLRGSRRVQVPESLWTCAGLHSADAVEILRAAGP